MDGQQHRLGEALPGKAGAYVVAAVVVLGVLGTGILLIAAAVRHEDAETRVDAHAPNPFTGVVRRMLGLHVYSGGSAPYGAPYGIPMRTSGAYGPQVDDRPSYGAVCDPRTCETFARYYWFSGAPAAEHVARTARLEPTREEIAGLLASIAPDPPPGRKLVLAAVAPGIPRQAEVLAWIPLREYDRAEETVRYHGPAPPTR